MQHGESENTWVLGDRETEHKEMIKKDRERKRGKKKRKRRKENLGVGLNVRYSRLGSRTLG